MEITIFKDIKDTAQPFYRDVSIIIERIKQGASQDIVRSIRSESDKEIRNQLKQSLPAICFSGKFTKRNDSSITLHSGLICLDFDNFPSEKQMLEEKERLTKDRYTYSVFISPSGLGLKVLVKIPAEDETHIKFFNSLQVHYDSEYFDKACRNVSRVCYESYDPLIFINEQSSVFNQITEQQYQEVIKHKDVQTIPITDENKIVEILMKWWERKYGFKDGERNNNIYILASAFNDFGVTQTLAEYVMSPFTSKDFTSGELKRTIKSAYAQKQNFGTKYYEDEERVNSVKAKMRRGLSNSEIKNTLEDETSIDDVVIDNVLRRFEEELDEQKFWNKSEKGVVKIIHMSFKNFLEDNGFYKFSPEGSKSYVFVKVTNNLIEHANEKEIKDFVLEYLLEVDDTSIYNYFAECTRYFREEFLTLLSSISVYFIADTKDTAYLYYTNCAVKITKDAVTPIDYLDLGGYVWKDHVINRVFDLCDITSCDFKTFVNNIAGSDPHRTKSMESTIGFLLHGWKNLSYCPATILNDEIISDNPEGGTGKGLYMTAISHMKKMVVIDGKSFNFEKSFAYQLVSADTQILCFDDVKKNFNFERLFSVVTEGLTLEKKNKDAIKIPFSKSPKVAITTNYAIKGKGNSFARRKWELELNQFYTKEFTPLVEFGKLMFGEWDDNDWCQFDNYMITNLQLYLDKGLLKSDFINQKTRTFAANTSYSFIEWCGVIDGKPHPKLVTDHRIYKNDLFLDFVDEYPDYAPKSRDSVNRNEFGKWLMSYAEFKHECKALEGRDGIGRWIEFVRKSHYIKQESLGI
tara:strand:- start:4022 stop:6433 length:2412 start_codon:yes stop_codon:yes gene_type:complete